VADDDDGYRAIARRYASMASHLEALRAVLPVKVAASAAGNAAIYTRRVINATPTDVQFDRELRAVFFKSLENESLVKMMVKILAVRRERMRKRYSEDGIDSVSVLTAWRWM
jgi:hypothetical protein